MGTNTEQQFCLKWNNHRSTLFSVFDNLLEEESLVDVTLSADGQFIRAHRVILSACSPYFRTLFRSSLLNDKHPVVFMKDVDFDNLKSLVEYMYKGEANVPQNMLGSFIRTAESLQIRGLAECATKQLESEGMSTPPTTVATPATPSSGSSKKKEKRTAAAAAAAAAVTVDTPITPVAPHPFGAGTPASILAARLGHGSSLFDFPPEMLFGRGLPMPQIPPPMKKPRKSADPKQSNSHFPSLPGFGLPMTLPKAKSKSKTDNSSAAANNNNYDSSDDSVLKIDEDADGGKENRSDQSPTKNVDEDANEIGASNGVSTEEEDEEEPSMPGPGPDISGSATGIVNPWTGEPISISGEDPDKTALEGISSLMDSMNAAKMAEFAKSGLSMTPTNNGSSNDISGGTPGSSDKDNITKYTCNRCGRSYLHQATLVRHQRYECGITASYPCPMCGRKFKRRDVLKGHMEKCANKSTQAAQAAAVHASAAAAAALSSSPLSIGSNTIPTTSSPLSGSSLAAAAVAMSMASPFTPPPSLGGTTITAAGGSSPFATPPPTTH